MNSRLPSSLESGIDAFLRQQREGIDRWSQSAGEAVRAEIERAVLQGLTDAFRRLADDLPRLLAGGLPSSPPAPANESPPLALHQPTPDAGDAEAAENSGPNDDVAKPACPPAPVAPEIHPPEVARPTTPYPLPEEAIARLRQGLKFARAEAFDRAVAEYTAAIRLNPAGVDAYLARAQSYCRLGQRDRAAADFQQAIQLAPHCLTGHLLLGRVRLAEARWDDAVAAYTAALRLDPRQAVAFLNRGLAHVHKGDADQAIRDAEEAIRLNPDLAEAYYLRAVACARQRKNDQAVADLTWLLERDPTLWRVHYTRGLAYLNQGKSDRAIADFSRALSLAPGLLTARFQRGVAFRLRGDLAYAIIDLTRFLQARPNSAPAFFQRGLAYLVGGQYDQAVADLDKAIELNPQDEAARSRREQAVQERDQERAALAPASAPAIPSPPASPDESAPAPPDPPTVPELPRPSAPKASSPTVLALQCPACGAGAQISWKRLDRKFKCRGCSRLFHVGSDGQFTEVAADGGPPRPVRRRRRVLASAAGLCLVAVLVGWFFLRPRAGGPDPLPHELKARAELWGKAWLANDRYKMLRLTDPARDKALHPWLVRHRAPQSADPGGRKGGDPDAEVEASVDRSGEHEAVLLLRVKSRSLKDRIEVRQNWVERADDWYFVPS